MTTGYRFDEFEPRIGSNVSVFRDLNSLKSFIGKQSGTYSKYWQVKGTVVKDEGGSDGLTIRVEYSCQVRV